MEAGEHLASLHAAAWLLKKGEHMMICAPDEQTSERIAELFASSEGAGALLMHRVQARTVKEALLRIRDQVKGHSPRKTLVVKWSGGQDRWARKEPNRITVIAALLSDLEKRGIRSVLVFPRPGFTEAAIGTLKDLPTIFASVVRFGEKTCCQILTARGMYGDEFFLPRFIDLNDPELPLGKPLLPVPAPAGTPGPAGGMTDLLQEPYREVIQSLHDGLILFDLSGAHRSQNLRAADLLGYSSSELSGISLSALVGRADYRTALRSVAMLRRGSPAAGELHIRRKSGRLIHVYYSASVVRGSLCVAVFRAVPGNGRRRDESVLREDRLRAIAAASPLPQAVFGTRKLEYANDPFLRLFPSVNPSAGKTTLRDFFGKQNAAWLARLPRTQPEDSSQSGVFRSDVELKVFDGSRRDFSVHAVQTTWDAKDSWFITLADVTERNEAVRALRSSEQMFRTIFEQQTAPVALLQDGAFAAVNQACASLFDCSTIEDLVGKELAPLVASRDRKILGNAIIGRARPHDEVRVLTFAMSRGDGEHRLIRMSFRGVIHAGKEALLCHFADVTDVQTLEKENRRSARERTVLGALSHEFHRSLEPDQVLDVVLHSSMKWLECSQGGVFTFTPDREVLELLRVEGLPAAITESLAVQSTTEGLSGLAVKSAEPLVLDVQNYPAYLPHKSLFSSEGIRTVVLLPLQAADEVNAVVMLCSPSDASHAAKDKQLLGNICHHAGRAFANALVYSDIRNADLKRRATIESLPDIVYEAGPSGILTYVSPRAEQVLGHNPDDFLRDPDLWRNLLHPDDRPEYSRKISQRIRGDEEVDLTYRMLPKGKAAYRWMRDAARYRRDPAGAFIGMTGIVSDITTRVEAEMAVAAAGGFHADVLQSVQEGFVVYDKDLRYREWNRVMELITGHGREQVIGRSALEGFPEFQLSDFTDLLHRALAGTPVSTEDVRYVRPGSEETIVLWCRFSPLRRSDGSTIGVVGSVTDVTDRKSLERELRESEETLRNVIDTMGDALMISDLQGKVWEVNREFSALTGFARGNVIGTNFPYPWLVEEEMPRYVVWLGALREQKFLRDYDMTWKRATGGTVAISLNTTLLRSATGEPVAMLNLARNISERKRLADALTAKSRQIEMLNRIISQANSSMELPRIFDLIAEELHALISYDHMNVRLLTADREHLIVHATAGQTEGFPAPGANLRLESSVSGLAVTGKEAVIIRDIMEETPAVNDPAIASAGVRSVVTLPIMFDEHVLGTFDLYAMTEGSFTGDELEYLQPIVDQIGALIDRTQLFRRVSEDSAYIRNLLDSIESVVYTVDRTSTIREVNTAWRDFAVQQGTPELGDETAVIGKPLETVVANESLKQELRQVMPQLFEGSKREFSHEFEMSIGPDERKSFQLAVTPMTVEHTVTGLVFTYTDITQIKKTQAEIKRRNEELMTLNAVAASINKSLDLEEVLAIATERIRSLLLADIVLCYLGDEQREAAVLAAHRGIDPERVDRLQRLTLPESASARGMVEGLPMLIEQGESAEGNLSEDGRRFLRDSGARSLLLCPLVSKERALGALVVGYAGSHRSSEQAHRLLRLVGNQLGSALENVRLYSEVQDQVRRVTLLYEIGKGLTGALDKRTILSVVHDELKKSVGFEEFAYFEWSAATHSVSIQSEQLGGVGIDSVDPGITKAGEGTPFAGVSVRGGSLLAVPVKKEARVIGILSLWARRSDAFTISHLRLLESIGNLAEIALDRATLYEDTVAKSEEIELRNKELDDFTYVVSHDLKEPLITIEGYSKIVMDDYRDTIDEEGKSYLNSVVQSSQRMKLLIDDLLTLSRIGRISEMQESLPLARIVTEVLRDLEFQLKESHATVEVPANLPSVRYNGTQLKMVLRNLIANAVKFNRSEAPRIAIAVRDGEKEYTVSVMDNGIGIERDHYEKIFVIFQRLQRTDDFRGTGAGLTIVKKIIENHHGRIWLESMVGEGSTFYFTIPK